MNHPPATYLNSSVMGNYLLNWSGLKLVPLKLQVAETHMVIWKFLFS